MRSKAQIKGHPVHPMLVTFPIAFFTGTFIFDVVFIWTNDPVFYLVAKYLLIAGLISAVIAATPGIIDYKYTVPPESSAKNRVIKHAVLNSSMFFLFMISFILREDILFPVVLMIEMVALILMSIAGWHGATLVHRNQIGVDHRYAGAGKWKETTIENEGNFIEVAKINELQTDQMKLLHINKKRIVLGRTAQGYVAFEDRCSHRGGSLAGGIMICGTVQCPWHGSQFDIVTGTVKAGPAQSSINVYKVEEKEGRVFLHIPGS